jgi:UDP-N-acetylmuramoyl-L-alanyl-D-glutamate--2,6-diaminopimelate ligase
MEVSSHAIDQARISGVQFSMALLTNVSRDHLDYHGTLEDYIETKCQFIRSCRRSKTIINADDSVGRRLIDSCHESRDIMAYSLKGKCVSVPTVFLESLERTESGIHINVNTPLGCASFHSSLLGEFNVSNLLAVLSCLLMAGFSLEKSVEAISTLQAIKGRLQTIRTPGFPLLVIDYAHTPDALKNALQTLKSMAGGRLFCVFGCGGDRDRGKRPVMASIAEQYADYVYLTDDNARFEDPEKIFQDILAGFKDSSRVIKEHDRALAIRRAISAAGIEDVVLIAGKGHEEYQCVNGMQHTFSDEQVIKQMIESETMKGEQVC